MVLPSLLALRTFLRPAPLIALHLAAISSALSANTGPEESRAVASEQERTDALKKFCSEHLDFSVLKGSYRRRHMIYKTQVKTIRQKYVYIYFESS